MQEIETLVQAFFKHDHFWLVINTVIIYIQQVFKQSVIDELCEEPSEKFNSAPTLASSAGGVWDWGGVYKITG